MPCTILLRATIVKMIDIAIKAAKGAGDLALQYFHNTPPVSYKPDHTPVTEADKAAEQFIRDIITKEFPDHGIHGEEYGETNMDKKYVWVIDPIDGTKDFVRMLPYWCTLLAILEDGKPIVGIAYFPYTKELFVAEKGKGAFLNDRRLQVSQVSEMKKAYISHGSPHHFARHNRVEATVTLTQSVQTARNFSAWAYNLLLKGKIDACIAARGDIHDFAATALLVEEAGGTFSDFSGVWKLDSDCAIFSNGLLHEDLLKIFK